MRGQPRLRRIVHRGSVEAHGFVVDQQALGDVAASSRTLSTWVPGAVVYAVEEGWLVCLPRPPRVRSERCPGLPLASVSGHLVAFPATTAEIAMLAPEGASLIRLRHGQLRVTPLRELERVDPARWIDLDAHREVVCDSLGAPPEAARPSIPEAAEFEPRQRLEGVPPEAPEAEDVLRAIVDKDTPAEGAPREAAKTVGGVAERLRSWLNGLLRRLARRVPRPRRTPATGRPIVPRGGVDRVVAWLRARLSRAVLLADLAQVIGRRQARYLSRMMEMFRRGDMDNALRHALPLAGPDDEPAAPALGVPRPRDDLRIRPGMVRPGPAIGGGPDLYQDLQAMYRAAFTQLDAQGEVEKAAFVLAELLHAHEEAVSYLERHGRLTLAAEMAEARGLPTGLVVRLWFLAGNRKRAIAIARREGAFADAIVRLERSGRRAEAAELRLLWADILASAGDYVAAVETVWPVPEARRLAGEWINRGIEQGGPAGARLLVRKLVLVPEAFRDVRDRALALLDNEDPEGSGARHALVTALHDADPTPAVRTLARAALRAALRDSASPGPRVTPTQYRDLVALTEDGALRSDVPPWPPPPRGQPLAERERPLRLALAPLDIGLMPVWDAALLPNGRIVLALGEAGLRLLSPAGRVVTHLEAPAHRLIVSDRGDRAIAMARRGEAWRLSQVDLVRHHAQTWCDARIDAAAPDYDGAIWFVATTDLLAIDATAGRFESLHRIPDVCAPKAAAWTRMARSLSRLFLHVVEPVAQVWTFALPSLTLRRREDVPARADRVAAPDRHIGLSAEGTVVEQDRPVDARAGAHRTLPRAAAPGVELRLISGSDVASVTVGSGDEEPGEPTVTGKWVATWLRSPDSCRVLLLDTKYAKIRAEIHLARAQRVALRLGPEFLTMGDDVGRLLLLDLAHGRLVRDKRT